MAYLNNDDLVRIYREIKHFAKEEKNYSYIEIKEYARLNNPEWYDALQHSGKLKEILSPYLKSARRQQRLNGEKPRTLKESIDKIIEERDT